MSNGSSALPGLAGSGEYAAAYPYISSGAAERLPVHPVGLREALEEDLVGALEVVAQVARDLGEAVRAAGLEQRVAGVRGEPAEHVGAHHRHHHRAVAAGRLPGQAAVVAVGERRVAVVHERHRLVAQVVLVAAEAARVQELRAAVGGPAVDERDDRVRALAGGEHRVEALDHRRLERRAVEPHVELAGVALDHVHARQRPRVVELDARRAVDVQRPPRRIAQRVVREQVRFDHQAVERAVHRPLPRRSRRTLHLVQCHRGERYRDAACAEPCCPSPC